MPEAPNPKIRTVPPPAVPRGARRHRPALRGAGRGDEFLVSRGASHPDELVYRAAELGYRAVAVTDVNTLGRRGAGARGGEEGGPETAGGRAAGLRRRLRRAGLGAGPGGVRPALPAADRRQAPGRQGRVLAFAVGPAGERGGAAGRARRRRTGSTRPASAGPCGCCGKRSATGCPWRPAALTAATTTGGWRAWRPWAGRRGCRSWRPTTSTTTTPPAGCSRTC